MQPRATFRKQRFEQGIGINSVNERLKVLFGQDYRMWIDSKLGEGTRTGIEIADVQVAAEVYQEVPAAGCAGASSRRQLPNTAWKSITTRVRGWYTTA